MSKMLEKLGFDKNALLEKGVEFIDDDEILKCRVNSYLAFEYLISELGREKSHYNCTWNRFYRGVSDEKYDLICSLCVHQLDSKESEIINSLYSRAPEEFSSCKSDFEMVALMQHYGLPTRLLDFTRNPMVALWFACQTDKFRGADGGVYVAFSARSTQQRIVNNVFKVALSNNIDRVLGLTNIMSKDELRQYIFDNRIHMNHMVFLDAPVVDSRERNQQAVFLLGINDIVISEKSNGNNAKMIDTMNLDEVMDSIYNDDVDLKLDLGEIHCYKKARDHEDILKIIIPKALKKEMLNELSIRGINNTFIYPTLDNYCKEIKEKAKQSREALEKNSYHYLEKRLRLMEKEE